MSLYDDGGADTFVRTLVPQPSVDAAAEARRSERQERETLLRFLDWAEGVAEDLDDADAVAGLRSAAEAVRRGLTD
ncbi:MAG: hypothetical protein AAF763_05905 [Pseudomonadota bacterium]